MVLIYLLTLFFFNLFLWQSLKGIFYENLGPLNLEIVGDEWSLRFFSLLRLISGSVFCWSYYYIDSEINYRRFLSLVIRFVSSIVLLIFFARLFGALIGWDGLGVTSFLLVIYFKNRKSLGSGIITALTNRLGDGFLLVLLALRLFPGNSSYLTTTLLILTAMTKSAQFPFSSWLPAAIAAPTPVRALVHSSTLVTAGIYLLIRFNNFNTEWLIVLGSVTIVIAGFCACAEIDIKKIVALRTLSQLGVIVVGLSLSLKNLCFFHLITHAIFKALLFICVGVGIHTIFGRQDFRSFSVLNKISSWPTFFLVISNFSLLGFPFLSGFFRKDRILESFYNHSISGFILIIFILGVGLTTRYRIKITNLALFSYNTESPGRLCGGGTNWQVKTPLLILGAFSIFGGFLLSRNYWASTPIIEITDKVIPLIGISAGVLIGFLVSNLKIAFFSSIWNLTPQYQNSSRLSTNIRYSYEIDGGWIELSGGPGYFSILKSISVIMQPILSLSLLLLIPFFF